MKCTIDDVTIYYQDFGSGKPIICLHGFPEDHRTMVGCLEPFFKGSKGYRRIYLDLPGMGKSSSKPTIKNADDMLTMLKRFVKKVVEKENFLLIGFSYGGYLSLGMLIETDFNIDGIFLICPCVISEREKRTLAIKGETLLEVGLESKVKNTVDFKDFLEYAVVATSETWSRYQNEILVGLKSADETFTENYQKNGYGFSFESSFNKLHFNKAITVITGKQDNCVGYEDSWNLLKHLTQLRFTCVEGAGHNLQIEHKETFNQHLNDWLKIVEASSF